MAENSQTEQGNPVDTGADIGVDIGRVGLWTGAFNDVSSAEARRWAAEAEELGYGAIWIPETVGRDPFILSTLILEATESIVMATGIANIYARDAMTMSAGQKTIWEAFPGRFLLGLGVSHHTLVSWVRKHEYSKPYSHMVEYLAFMSKALYLAPGPEQRPPTVLAALGPKMLKLAAESADGAHPYLTTPEHTAAAREILGPDPLLAPEQMVVLETDPAAAREIARKHLKVYLSLPNYQNNLKRYGLDDSDFEDGGSDRLIDAVIAWGDEAAIAARVAEHHAAGADHVCVQALCAESAETPGVWRRLAPALLEG
ncbi:MAG TPA: LLM class F420-dependent oxidoreductase [Acidimicrobiales bacterium]|nr:LLM class F420-dependent oxidoreductase [Acidimicrobiales bacterium]